METESLNDWKYPKLLNHAKDLGIVFDHPKPKKSIVVDAIESHMKVQQAAAMLQPKTPVQDEIKPSKKTRGRPKTVKVQEEIAEAINVQETPAAQDEQIEEPAPEKPKKMKKKTTKSKKSEPGNDIAEEETQKANKRSTRASSVVRPVAEPTTPQNQPTSAVVNALTKSIRRTLNHQIQSVVFAQAEQQDEKVSGEKQAVRVGRKKKSTNKEETVPANQASEPAVDQEVQAKKTSKKTKKSTSEKKLAHETFSAAQVLESIVTENVQPTKTPQKSKLTMPSAHPEEKDVSAKSFELRLDEDTNEAHPVVNEATVVKHKLPEASLLTSDEDEPVVKSRRNTPAKPTRSHSVDTTRVINKTLNITNDISSDTFSKTPSKTPCKTPSKHLGDAQVTVSCASFYNVAQAAPAEEPKAAQPVVPCIMIQPPINEPQGAAKLKAGGARIVRPKQLVSEATVQDVIAVAPPSELPTKKMEIVQREAGPRIVKPKVLGENETTESKSANKVIRKRGFSADPAATRTLSAPTTASNQLTVPAAEKKTSSAKKTSVVPDFKAIHEREAKKMLSLEEHAQKKQERQAKLLVKPVAGVEAPANSEAKSKLKTPNSLANRLASIKTKTPSRLLAKTPTSAKIVKPTKTPASTKVIKPSKTPKIAKPVLKASNQLNVAAAANKETTSDVKKPVKTIPKLNPTTKAKIETETVNDENKPTMVENDPSTPVMAGRRVSNFTSATKTPTSTIKPSASTLNQSATKKPTNFVFGSNANAPSASTLLATSSFNRRKSFDLNASLAKQLSYKPHAGKLKPIDFAAKSIFLKTLQDPTRPNAANITTNISTMPVDTTVVVDKTSSTPKALAPGQAKRRQSNILLSSIRPVSSVSITGAKEASSQAVAGSKTHLLQQAVRNHTKESTDKMRLAEKKLRIEQRINTVTKNRQLDIPTN